MVEVRTIFRKQRSLDKVTDKGIQRIQFMVNAVEENYKKHH